MKKLLFLALIMIFANSNIKAQLQMSSSGNIDIETTPNPVDWTKLGVTFASSSYTSLDGLSTNFGLKTVNIPQSAGLVYIGLYGSSYYSTPSSARTIGVYGMAGNATSGYNYGVAGILKGSNLGAGIYGASYGNGFVGTLGNWAGYFNGNVNMVGGLDVSGSVGIGTTTPNNLLQVQNIISFNNTLNNTFLGYQIGLNSTGNNNTVIGYNALYSNTTGYYNTATGYNALYSNTTGGFNSGFGSLALFSNTTGYFNSALGDAALLSNTTGEYNTANGTGALYYNNTGSYNSALGYFAGYGASGVNFSQCTFVGADSYPTQARTNVTMLGYGIVDAQCTGNNQVCVGNTTVAKIWGQVGFTTYSDARFKTNIKDSVVGLDFILKLKPVTFNVLPKVLNQIWGTPDSLVNKMDFSDAEKETRIGFIAQDVEQAANACGFKFPGLDVPSNDKEVYCLRYVDFIMPIVKAIQELNTKNDSLKSQLAEAKSQTDSILAGAIKQQNATIAELQQQIDKCCNTNTGSLKSNKKASDQDSSDVNNSNNSGSPAVLYQNAPNPFTQGTQIKCYIPRESMDAAIYIYDMQGHQIKKKQINGQEYVYLTIQGYELAAGMYMYTLIIDGKEIDTKKMILTK